MAYVNNRYFIIPKSVASNYLTTGKTYPKENPECTQYYAKRTFTSEGQCGPASQSTALRQALGYDWYPWTPIKHGRGKNENGEYVAQFDSCLETKSYDRETGTWITIPCKPQKPDLSTTFNDDRWPKDMGETGSGIAGYEGCKQLCDNNEKCVAFESARPVGKTYNKTTGVLEADPNSKFRCILWSGRGDYEGAAIVSQNRTYSPYSDTDKAGICWTKKCQNDMRYAVPQYAGGTAQGVRTNTVQGETQFVDRTGSGARSVINVISTDGFPNSGTLNINSRFGPHLVTYTGKTSTSFTGCVAPSYPGSTELPAGSLVTDNTDERNSWVNTANYSAKGSWYYNDDNDSYVTTLDGRRGRDVIETELGLADWVYEQGPVGQTRKRRDAEEQYCCGWRNENGKYIQEGAEPDVNCQYSEWSPWTDCTCETNKTRTRTITQQSQGNGTPCNETLFQSSSCLEKCDVDCEMTEWTDWTECSEPCGTGTQIRSRYVRRQPQNNGAPCSDNILESRICNTHTCPGDEPPNPVNCRMSTWSAWGNCDKTCGGGTQTRTRVVEQEPLHGGTPCPTNLTETQPCNTQECVDPNPPPAPIDCQTSNWSNWSECTKTCGSGTQTRSRDIIQQPQNGGNVCPSNLTETQECNRQACASDCTGEFSSLSECSTECGPGTQTQIYSITKQAEGGGNPCPYADGQAVSVPCNKGGCPIDCNYEIIYDGSCSKECGGGIETGRYNIITPAANGGRECPTGTPQRTCNVQPCPEPGDCEYEIIYDGACSKDCGTGTQTGRYNITKQPENNGQACPTGNPPTRECNTQPCPQAVNCDYEVIYDGECSKACGGGKKSGRYNIKTQPMYGGLACPTGIPNQIDCNMQSCETSPTVNKDSEEEEKDNSLRNLAIIGGVVFLLCSFFMMFMLIALK